MLATKFSFSGKIFLSAFFLITAISARAQENSASVFDFGRLSGNFQLDAQQYNEDSAIGAPNVREKILTNGYLNLLYTRGPIQAGIRYEAYLNPIQGFDTRYTGSGIPYRFLTYTGEMADVTVGNFYEQFGNGLLLRAYEERALGYDNAFDGLRVNFRPTNGIRLTGLIGKQREFFSLGKGIVRALDGEFSLGETFPDLLGSTTRWTLGASGVSKFQTDDDVDFRLPENVFGWAARSDLGLGDFAINAEYAYKINDPADVNQLSGFDSSSAPKEPNYNPGTALYTALTYAASGFGATLEFKRIDNMNFRSDRAATLNVLNINYLPATTRQHTYRLVTLYPYATQPNGEIGYQADFVYTIPKNTFLGGKYGTNINLNFSRVSSLDTQRTDRYTYTSKFFSEGSQLYYQDINIEMNKTWSRELKTLIMFSNMTYNKEVVEVKAGAGTVHANIIVADISYQLNAHQALRTELQHLQTKQDMGNWMFGLLEYTLAPSWYFTIFDEWNYGNKDEKKQFHYFSGSVAYVHDALRVSLGYGRQRQGILCVGGVCRVVPASNGLALSVSQSF